MSEQELVDLKNSVLKTCLDTDSQIIHHFCYEWMIINRFVNDLMVYGWESNKKVYFEKFVDQMKNSPSLDKY